MNNKTYRLNLSYLNLTDKLILLYNATITVHIVISISKLSFWLPLLIIHIALFAIIWFIIQYAAQNSSPALGWLHIWYPLITLFWFYPEVGLLRHTVIPNDLDSLLLNIETSLFPQRYYFTIPLSLSVSSLELFHGIYFSYYFFIFIPALVAYKNHCKLVKEYIFVLIFIMVTHYWFQIIFPSSGPVSLREDIMPAGIFFIPIMDWLYTYMDNGGAAFPSTHVAAALVAWIYAGKFFPEIKLTLFAVFMVITLSSIICTFHYTIDSLAGIITGVIGYRFGRTIYATHS